MKISKYKEAEFLEKVFGKLPLDVHLGKSESKLAIGDFKITWEDIKTIALEKDDVFDYLVDLYNEELRNRQKKLRAFERRIPPSLEKVFKRSFEQKRESLGFVLKISEKRLDYLSYKPSSDEKKASLSMFQSELTLYKNEFLSKVPSTFFLNRTFKTLLPFYNRARHTYILGGTGSGKSEFLKIFAWSDIQNKVGNLVLDPHGELVQHISKYKTENELLYLSPEFGKYGYYFRFNPFDHEFHNKPEREKQAFISVKSQELLNAFAIVMGTEFSENMKRIVFNILQVLLNTKGMKLNDFLMFLRPATSEPYENLALQHYSKNVRLYFKHDFNEKRLEITKASVLTRFENALANYHLTNIFDCEQSSFNLKKSLNQGKSILINASQGILGEQGSRLLGSFLLSELTTLALQKANIPEQYRKPWMVYLDEVQNFLTPRIDKILAEARKYGLHLTMANQYINQIENVRLRSSILANTNIKCVGLSSNKDFELMSKEMGYKDKEIPKLGGGRFIIKIGSFSPIAVQAYDFLVDTQGVSYIDRETHRKRLNEVLKKYYTKSLPKSKTEPEEKLIQTHIPIPKPEKLL